jgi:hypothetical protein
MVWKPVKCLVPQRLRELGKTQRWLAAEVDETEQQVSDICTMHRKLGIARGKKYAHVLKCHIDDLYKWEVLEEPSK